MCNVWDQLGPGLSLSHGIMWGRFCLSPPDIAPLPVTQEQFTLILRSTERSCHQCYTVKVSISCGEMGYADIIPLNVRDMMCKENLWWFRKANIWLRSWDSGGSCEDGLGLSCLWGWWGILVCHWNSPGTWSSAINVWSVERDTMGRESSVAG